MSDQENNRFSNTFLSLQLQLRTLLEEAGGDELMPFLDMLGGLNKSEQKMLLQVMSKTIQKLLSTTPRLETDGDLALKHFEDNLYEDLLAAIESGGKLPFGKKKMELISGGKEKKESEKTPVNIEEARKKRKIRVETTLN